VSMQTRPWTRARYVSTLARRRQARRRCPSGSASDVMRPSLGGRAAQQPSRHWAWGNVCRCLLPSRRTHGVQGRPACGCDPPWPRQPRQPMPASPVTTCRPRCRCWRIFVVHPCMHRGGACTHHGR